MHAPPRYLRKRVVRRFIPAVLVAAIMATAIKAGPLPNLLDDNRGNFALAALETAAFNGALAVLAPIFLNPLSPAFSYPPVILNGRVLSHPKIHNLYLDSDWDAHKLLIPHGKAGQAREQRLLPRRQPVRDRQCILHRFSRARRHLHAL